MNKLKALIYPVLQALTRLMSKHVKFIHRVRLNKLWHIIFNLLQKDSDYIKSVYGPWLSGKLGDHQFHLCVTGKSGFYLSDVIKAIRKPTVFIDVGSNLGLYAILAAENTLIKKVYAIEPNPIVVSFLNNNISKNNFQNIVVVQAAVSNETGFVELRYDDAHLGMGSIERAGKNSIQVKSVNRNYFNDIALNNDADLFVKVDVEGAEDTVIEELFSSNLRNRIDSIFVEITPKWLTKEKEDQIYSILYRNGFKLSWKSKASDQYDAFFTKNPIYKKIDQLKFSSVSKSEIPKYSICVSNFNMGDTIYRAISSVAKQLDNNYEVLILDDGSSDNSKIEIQRLQNEYSNVRAIYLDRDRNRQLGETRNISVYAALGEYVLLHIDADDVWESYLSDLVKIFHKLEDAYKKDFLLVGQQTGIVKRNFLLEVGGYDNLYRGEDRSLMFKLAKLERILFLDYKTFRTRLPRPTKKRLIKIVWDLWSHLQYDILCTESATEYIIVALLFSYKNKKFSIRLRTLRAILIIPAFLSVVFKKKQPLPLSWQEFLSYRQVMRGNFSTLINALGYSCDLSSIVGKDAIEIFEYKLTGLGFKGE